jgi:hypothetical protein
MTPPASMTPVGPYAPKSVKEEDILPNTIPILVRQNGIFLKNPKKINLRLQCQ